MRKIISFLILVLVTALLAGCSGGTSKTDTAATKEQTNVDNKKTEAAGKEAKTEEVVTYKDGTYEGVGEGMHEIKVSVEVANGKIVKVEITKQEETEDIAKPALDKIPAAIVEKNSPDVDVISGATLASEGIIAAVKNALENAK